MYAAARLAAVAEATLELGDERGAVELRVLLGEPHEPGEVVLAHGLPFSELVRRVRRPAAFLGEAADVRGRAETPQHVARALAAEKRRPLRRDAGLVQRLLEVGEPRVRAAEDRHRVERQSERADLLDDEARLVGARPELGFRPVVARRPQRLLRAA